MTVPIRVKRKCSVCGFVSIQTELASTSRFGSPDLDTRPPEMMRSSMGWWIQECPRCGFVSSDISSEEDIVPKWLLKHPKYVTCIGLDIHSSLGRNFIKALFIHVYTKNWNSAFADALHAAWACDDNDKDVENAVICRKLAIECMERFQLNDSLKTVKADLLRRAGLFSQVISEYEHFTSNDKKLERIISFQVEKAKLKDTGCYTLDDV